MSEQQLDNPDQSSLTGEEIGHIEDALNFLHHGLKQAKGRFKNSVSEDDGRDGAVHALEYVLKFFTILKETGIYTLIVDEGVHAPLARLFDDLMSLDDGNVSVMLRPKKKTGRPRASGAYDALKGIAVFTVRRLTGTGFSLRDARGAVAGTMASQGVRPTRRGSAHGSGQFSERTLRKWQEDIEADVGCHTTATETLRQAEAAHSLAYGTFVTLSRPGRTSPRHATQRGSY